MYGIIRQRVPEYLGNSIVVMLCPPWLMYLRSGQRSPRSGTPDPTCPSAISPALPGASRGSASPMPYPRWSFGTGADRRTGWRGGPSWIGGRSKWLPRVILDLVQRWSPVGRIAGLADAPQVDRARKTKDVGQVHGEEPEAKAD